MLKRNIVCPSSDDAKLLKAWLPQHIVDSSLFYLSTSQTLADCHAAPILRENELQLLLIRNAYTYHEELILDMEGDSEEMLSLYSSERRFEVEVVAPALEWMLFETPELFESIFRDKATSRLQLIGSYEPDRAIREAGSTVDDIIARVDEKTRELLRATPTAQRILKRIERLDEKLFT
ncbi:hypothetical protein [Pandoraea commovens]|uniref:Uncharacterized protein n=1 Tax=Pandoraea commovens TaxID=2508289 RepID=A0A5E4UA11_9BURK|nr:hypothetical protein [Pandoraea commovens]UVA79844.1 hypothetical protein NTU39_02055 [Pandoraea commovens]VVD96352.1 hypothetical protein PCO31010_01912 [Pandoraea commovens]